MIRCIQSWEDIFGEPPRPPITVTASDEADTRCSFCARHADDLAYMVTTATGAAICNECIGICASMAMEAGFPVPIKPKAANEGQPA